MIHLIWIIPAYIAVGFRISYYADAGADNAAWIIMLWPLCIVFCVLAGVHDGIRRVLTKTEDKHHDNR